MFTTLARVVLLGLMAAALLIPGGTAAAAELKPATETANDWVHPAPGHRTSSNFGPRAGGPHYGHDVAAPTGAPIQAVGKGKVVEVGWWSPGYGRSILVDHGDYLTHYAHLSKSRVSKGDVVHPGRVIGDIGNTGDSTGPHLHFEVHKGRWLNPVEPVPWLKNRGVNL